MTCKLERPAPQELFNRYLQMFSSTVLGGAEVIPESNEWYASSINYAMAEEFFAISEQAWKERDPREACCENLIEMAEQDGVYPRPPTYAQGYLKLSGAPGASLTSPLEFDVGGVPFITASTSSQPSFIGDNGTTIVRVRAVSPGVSGNVIEESGTMTTSVPNVDKEVVVCGGTFCEGDDAEGCEQFRSRYLRRLQYQPRATNQWILDKLLEWPCATRAIQRAGSCCQCNDCGTSASGCVDCGCKDCGGQLSFYVMFDNSFPCGIATKEILEEVQTWMFGYPQGYGLGQVEVGICGNVVPVQGVLVDVMIDIADCPTVAELDQVRMTISEFFTTLEPSKPLRIRSINTILANIIGAETNFEARVELVDPNDGYGNGNPRDANSKVFVGNCDLEPECDVMLCLREITINRPDTSGADC